MNRELGFERVYKLGDFKTARFSDVIRDIPQDILLNPDAVNTLRILQFIQVEKSYYTYLKLRNNLREMDENSAIDVLDELNTKTVREYNEIINNQ